MAAPSPGPPNANANNEEDQDDNPLLLYEHHHVHAVYQHIAPHFAATRHTPWPVIAAFLRALPSGSVGLDLGCGNGKYLDLRREDVLVLGSDRSEALVGIARQRVAGGGGEVVVGDVLNLPFCVGGGAGFDFAISIAVVHHLASRGRRVGALRAALEVLREGGRLLVFVWALEQEGSRRGWKRGGVQDVMVPWVMRGGGGKGEGEEDKVFQRYYHLYCEGELEGDVQAAGGKVLEKGYERDNWWVVATPG